MNTWGERVRSFAAVSGIAGLLIGLGVGYVIGTAPWEPDIQPKTGWRHVGLGCDEDCDYYVGQDKFDLKCYCQTDDPDAPCYTLEAFCNDDNGLGSNEKPEVEEKD